MIEYKKCKGSGKAKGHGCGKMVKAKFRKYGLGMECKCYHKWLLNTDVGQSIVAQTTLRATKNRRSLEDAKAESKNKRLIVAGWINGVRLIDNMPMGESK